MSLSAEYRAYMHSPTWYKRRARVLRLADYRCRVCGGKATQVHHVTYENFGHEPDCDLTALCKDCHTAVTWLLRARRLLAGGKHRRKRG